MRNLKLLMHNNFKSEKLNDARIFCVDNVDNVVYFATKDLLLFKLHSGYKELELCVNLNEYKGFLDQDTNVIALTYLFVEESLCISSSSGSSVLFDALSGTIYDFYSAEENDNGVKCLCWSPDQEVFVIITGNDVLRIISRSLEVVCEPSSLHDDYAVKSLALGWGSKETQFHSSVEMQDQEYERENKKITLANDDCKTRVSWRCDGQMFAVSFVNPATATRIIRIWSREGTFLASSEALNGLEQSLSWQPSGSLIASTLRISNRHKVVFLERNCLPHGEFTLPFHESKAKVREVLWNVDGTLLAVWSENLIMEVENETNDQPLACHLHIWAVSNYHWYCKHSLSSTYLKFPLIVAMQWDCKIANKLHILCQDGFYFCCRWSWSLDHKISNSKIDHGIVSVINGGKILATSFRHMIIPPPLSSFQYSLQKNVNAIIFPAFANSNDMLSVMEDSSVAFFTSDHKEIFGNDQTTIQLESLHLKAIYRLNWKSSKDVPSSLLSLRHWIWISKSTLIFVFTLHYTSMIAFTSIELTSGDTEFVIKKCLPLPGEPIFVIPFTDEKTVVVHMLDGSMLAVNLDDIAIRRWTVDDYSALTLPKVCYKMSAVTREGQSRILSLSENCNLYLDAFELANNCTSYFLVEEFLLFTTHAHELHCMPIRSLLKSTGSIRTGDGCLIPRQVRKIERGSKIVMAVMSECKVILQVPRGNLEAIYPRPLVLYLVCHHLNNLQYKDALLLIRKHRIDMNLIFDHDPELFLINVKKFVEQLTDATWINLFLSGLQEEDVTTTLYKNACMSLECNYAEGRRPRQNKIDVVCDATLNAMEAMDSNKYFLGILTAHVKKSKPELDIALRKIQLLRENQGNHVVCCDTAIAHLLYLVDINELYNVALGTYDFDLVLMVAEKSQKDPKEYLPFLNDLKVLEVNYRRFKIDKFLKRYNKALHNILQCDVERHSECLAFIREHNLYSEALRNISCTSQLYKAVLYEYGNYLVVHDKFNEAGIMYTKGDFYNEAMEAFKRSGNWKQGLMIAYKMNYSRQDITLLAKHFSDFLSDNNEVIDASYVEEVYANDPQRSILILINGHEWDRALLKMHKYSMLNFLDSHLLPKLSEHYVTLTKTLQSLKTCFQTYKDRLNVLKQEKLDAQVNGNDAIHSYSDVFSETSSVSDMSSLSLSRSASALSSLATQKKKKKTRQVVSLRKGSRYEDVALYEALTNIIIQIDNYKEECGNLIKALLLHDFGSDAKNLQLKMDSLTTYVQSCISDIWTVEKVIDVRHAVQVGSENVRWNRDVPQEYQQFLNPPCLRNRNDWKLTCL